MSKKIIWSQQDIDDISNLYKNGATMQDIAKQYKCSITPIYNIIPDELKVQQGRTHLKDPNIIKKIISLYKDGMTLKEVSDEIGYGQTAIRRCLDKHRISIRSNSQSRKLKNKLYDLSCADQIKKEYLQGESIKKLSTKYEYSEKSIRACLIRNNVKIRKGGEWRLTKQGGGIKICKNGYKSIHTSLLSDHERTLFAPMFYNNRIDEHRLVMARHIGRPLYKTEHVHHIDRNKNNNDISNLKLMRAKDHLKLHNVQKGTSTRAKISILEEKVTGLESQIQALWSMIQLLGEPDNPVQLHMFSILGVKKRGNG